MQKSGGIRYLSTLLIFNHFHSYGKCFSKKSPNQSIFHFHSHSINMQYLTLSQRVKNFAHIADTMAQRYNTHI